MQKFIYKRENGQVHIEAMEMSLTRLAAEVGELCRELYSGLYRQEPEAANIFKTSVVMAIAHPDSPTWNVKQQSEDGITICAPSKKHE